MSPIEKRYDLLNAANIRRREKAIAGAYKKTAIAVGKLKTAVSLNKADEFYFRNFSDVNEKVDILMNNLFTEVNGFMAEGVQTSWDLAVEKNNAIAQSVFGKTWDKLPDKIKQAYLSNNQSALNNFLTRKENGLGLSDKIWNNTKQFKQELELGLQTGILSGQSASGMARDLQKFLVDPDKLFRRVRKEPGGELRLSKNAAAYHPGQGRYRSSYKNANRLARNEINFSYEGANYLKNQQQDFVVGIEIKVSPSHNPADDAGGVSCVALQGLYPKDFDFTFKWHVNCKCTSFKVLKTPEELDADLDLILDGKEPNSGSVNTVSGVPTKYKDYVDNNAEKWEKYKTYPRTFETNMKIGHSG